MLWPLILILSVSHAQTKQKDTSIIKKVDATQQIISKGVLDFSNAVDQFFASETYEAETNKTHIRVGAGIAYPFEERPVDSSEFRFHLSLPNTQKQLNIVVENLADSLEEESGDSSSPRTDAEATNATEADEYSAALRWFFIQTKNWKFSTDAGARLRFPLDPFLKVRARRNIESGKWLTKISATAFWFESKGAGHQESVLFSRRLNDEILFRHSNTLTWLERTKITTFTHAYTLYHRMNDREIMGYTVAATSDDKPFWRIENYSLEIRYRTKLYKDWLFFETKPRFDYPRDRSFALTPSISFLLEIVLGKLPKSYQF